IGLHRDLHRWPTAPPATHQAVLPPGYPMPPASVQIPLEFIHHGEMLVDLSRARRPAVTVQEAIGDLPALTDHLLDDRSRPRADFRRDLAYPRSPTSEFGRLMRGWPGLPEQTCIVDHAIRRTPRDYATFARMEPGDRYPDALVIAEKRLAEE